MENIDNNIQLIVSGFCAAVAITRAISTARRTWMLLAVCYTAGMLADLYWLLYYIFNGSTPDLFYIPYLGWYVSTLFLYIFLNEITLRKAGEKSRLMWVVPAFTAAMCVFYMFYGDYISNLIAATIMALLGCEVINGLHALKLRSREGIEQVKLRCHRRLYIAAGLFFIAVYGMWTASCFLTVDSVLSPYYWFDFMKAVMMLIILLFASPVIGLSERKDEAVA